MSQDQTATPADLRPTAAPRRREKPGEIAQDRTRLGLYWYWMVQWFFSTMMASTHGLRVTGRENIPDRGAAMMVSNHLSHLDVLVLGILLRRPLNYVARSSLFFFPLGPFIRSCGAFPIQRDGIGAQGLKETLRRLKAGGIVALFPEGTRTPDGELAELKAGIAMLAAKAKVPILPAAIAGTFEAWPRTRPFPSPPPDPRALRPGDHPRAGQGRSAPRPPPPLIRERILECQAIAREGPRPAGEPGRPVIRPPRPAALPARLERTGIGRSRAVRVDSDRPRAGRPRPLGASRPHLRSRTDQLIPTDLPHCASRAR